MAKSKSRRRETVPHNGKDIRVSRIEKIGRTTHHFFTDPVDGLEKDYVEIDHPDHSLSNAMDDNED